MAGADGSGLGWWIAGVAGFLALRRRRRERRAQRRERRAAGSGPTRRVVLPDGREALQVTAGLFAPDDSAAAGDGTWWRAAVLGTAACQDALDLTRAEVAPGRRTAVDVPTVLLPLGTRRRVTAVDAYATGGRIGHLPGDAVAAVGATLRATQEADGRPCAVLGRIDETSDGILVAEVLLPDRFEPGAGG